MKTMEYKHLKFNSKEEYDAAASVYGEILLTKQPPAASEPYIPVMYVLLDDVEPLEAALNKRGVKYEAV